MNAIPAEKMDRSMLDRIGSANRAELKRGVDNILALHPYIRKVLLISPVVDDYQFIKAHYPQFDIYITQIGDWDLNQPCPLDLGSFDLAIASNVMMYSHDPQAWVDHVLAVARFFVIQDIAYRKRSGSPPYLGTDQDAVRYHFPARAVYSPFPHAFDLGTLRQTVVYFAGFHGGLNHFHAAQDPPVHVVAIVASNQPTPPFTDDVALLRKLRFKARNLAFSNEFINKIYRNILKIIR